MAKKAVVIDGEEVTIRGFVTTQQSDASQIISAIENLVMSGIITHSDGMVTWREGHLAHIANLYKGDPTKTERDYSDDVAVARKYSADEWSALLEA